MNWFFRKYIEQGRQEMLTQVIHKFQELYDDYYGQGQFDDANLIVDLVAYLQDDYEAISNND
jgi:hypothetical protein